MDKLELFPDKYYLMRERPHQKEPIEHRGDPTVELIYTMDGSLFTVPLVSLITDDYTLATDGKYLFVISVNRYFAGLQVVEGEQLLIEVFTDCKNKIIDSRMFKSPDKHRYLLESTGLCKYIHEQYPPGGLKVE